MNDFAILELFMCQFKDEIISFSITTHSDEKHLSQKYARYNQEKYDTINKERKLCAFTFKQ